MTTPDNDDGLDEEYAGDLEDDAAVADKLPVPHDPAQVPPDQGDAGPAGVKGGSE